MVCIFLHSMVLTLWSDEPGKQSDFDGQTGAQPASVYQLDLNPNSKKISYLDLLPIIAWFEEEQRININPKNFHKIAIYFDTRIAPGLCISKNILSAVVEFLEIRGFGKDEISLVTYKMEHETLQSLQKDFPACPIITSESEKYFHGNWFHDSPLPPATGDRADLLIKYPKEASTRKIMERKSFLPACLFLRNTWVINLAKAKDDYHLGIDGMIANISLNASSNTLRFRDDATMGPATATEILAIPEFWEKQLFSLMDLSTMQIAGGPGFDAEFIRKEPYLLLSKNPVFVDYQAIKIIDKKRIAAGLKPKNTNHYKLFKFAKQLGLGDPLESKVVKLKAP